ncbi:hypothetical protein BASA50_007186 [Batrachochytrium salamandrivorans]|uniref:Uncharacterized protein n=1 Tax=Batrachochytrium salamandrivorans TaxID=1357716 RepID=A0ABQ8F7L6_9FUNG|nr:hypothetical protein BASA50_007186 [Batrachochytrium salamandrivorans]
MDPSEAKCVYDDHRDCADGICLSSAIARHNKILMESTSPDDPGAEESMKYIIHYVSDHLGYGYPEKRVRDDFQDSPALYASYLIRSIKTGENKVLSESWTSKLPIDAVNDIGNSMAAIEYTTDSYELSCSVIWAKYNEYRRTNLGGQYYSDVIKTLDMQISKAGLRVAYWLNHLARLHSQTKVDAATLSTAHPGKSNIEKHPSSPRESMPQSKKGPSMSSKQLASGHRNQMIHHHRKVIMTTIKWWVTMIRNGKLLKRKAHVLALPPPKGKGTTHQKEKKGATRQSKQ